MVLRRSKEQEIKLYIAPETQAKLDAVERISKEYADLAPRLESTMAELARAMSDASRILRELNETIDRAKAQRRKPIIRNN